MEVTRLVNDDENDCRFEVKGKNTGYTSTYRLVAVRERLLKFFVTKLAHASICSGIGCDTSS